MKKIISAFYLCFLKSIKKLAIAVSVFSFHNAYSQCPEQYYCLLADSSQDALCMYHLTIDTMPPNNIWQIGLAQKPVFDSTVCPSKVLVTDTANPYPVNNHSAFTITNLATMGDIYGFRIFAGGYYVQTDSLSDYGKIELSIDNGSNWMDITDTAYSNVFLWFGPRPVLTGHSVTCKDFAVDIANLVSIDSTLQVGDTLLFRFSFFSDSIYDNLGGLVFDYICFSDFVEGISEIHFQPVKSIIYPNPSSSGFTIKFDNPDAEPFELVIYDMQSKPLLTRKDITADKIMLEPNLFKPGMYVYKLTNIEVKKRSWGRFVSTK